MLVRRLSLALLSFALSSTALAKVHIVVSVDWEGRELDEQNLAAMTAFRHDFPDIPLQHFLNAAYFTKAGADPAAVTRSIRSVLRPGDEQGLHIHPWRSLVQAAGVTFRSEPAFRGYLDLSKCGPDCGHDVNLASYSEPELRRLLRTSLEILKEQGFERARSFRAGAWQAEMRTFRALAAEGFTVDASATYAGYLRERWGKSLLYPVVAKIWPTIVTTSQPYTISLEGGRSLLELPNNGCLADYMTSAALLEAFQQNVALWRRDPQRNVYFSIGFHQETAKKFLPQFREGLDAIRTMAQREAIPIVFETSSSLQPRPMLGQR